MRYCRLTFPRQSSAPADYIEAGLAATASAAPRPDRRSRVELERVVECVRARPVQTLAREVIIKLSLRTQRKADRWSDRSERDQPPGSAPATIHVIVPEIAAVCKGLRLNYRPQHSSSNPAAPNFCIPPAPEHGAAGSDCDPLRAARRNECSANKAKLHGAFCVVQKACSKSLPGPHEQAYLCTGNAS